MKIAVIAPTYLPARRANTIQVMKMAQALAALGHDLRVLVPRGNTTTHPAWNEMSHHYGLRQYFEIEWLQTDPRLRSYDFGLTSVKRAWHWGADLIYTRLPQAAALASSLGMPSIYEIHDLPQGRFGPWLMERFLKGKGARALVVITAALKESMAEMFGIVKGDQTGSLMPIIIAPDGVDLARYQNLPTPQQARQSLSSSFTLQPSSFTAGYTGHLYPGRGANLILEIAGRLPDMDFLLVGGETSDVDRVRQTIKSHGLDNITLTGFIPNAELPQYQAACDILLMPYQHRVAASSGGDLSTNPEQRARLAAQAQQDVIQYSWRARAQNIISTIQADSQISNP
jgi:glycosyltransferase involved in cell wall biosynthesis